MKPPASLSAERDQRDAPVVIIRSGYASDDLWHRAIGQALHYGRTVIAIAADGTTVDPHAV